MQVPYNHITILSTNQAYGVGFDPYHEERHGAAWLHQEDAYVRGNEYGGWDLNDKSLEKGGGEIGAMYGNPIGTCVNV